ncbi:hypothetical protein FCM35_KLT16297 [Carex littledalei]|uniref:Uncharacterized protein n=1 Tax=Carex littledalei TaxID=544730 RepID=A0A833RN00_9POAL|nr:hypothetical protein FCM35_KLT16297 [Carex littledalei]
MIPLLLQIGPQCTDSALSLILLFMSGPYLQSYAGQEAKLKKVEVDEFQLELWCRSALTRALMPGDEETMSDQAIWETLPFRFRYGMEFILFRF